MNGDLQAVLFEKVDGLGIVTINRPAARNAIDRDAALGVAAAIETIESDPEIRVGILTGAGGTFCAGLDLKAFLRGDVVKFPKGGFAGLAEAEIAKPMIAAVEGYALAGGFELALACDLIIASREARFGLPEVKRGLVARSGGMVRLPRQLPYRIAMELLLTGELVPAPRLAAYGLFNRIVEPGEALAAATEMGRSIARNGPLAIAVSKRVMRESQDWDSREMFARQIEMTEPVFRSADACEGALAFAEKREPVWRGE
ncbi:MAG: enoyl-CoA hydratase [Sphingomonadales bacterium]|jgi:enoyl-CoA hydratase|nr:enoyl-CoA hydratase [Sphingomonadales bacterium]